MIDDRFLTIVRRHLRDLVPAEELAPDAPLHELGLDSLAMVRLIVDLEIELGVALPERHLTTETFADLATLWSAVSKSMRA